MQPSKPAKQIVTIQLQKTFCGATFVETVVGVSPLFIKWRSAAKQQTTIVRLPQKAMTM